MGASYKQKNTTFLDELLCYYHYLLRLLLTCLISEMNNIEENIFSYTFFIIKPLYFYKKALQVQVVALQLL